MKNNEPFALFIRGTSGSGKSTVAYAIAVEEKGVLLGHDTFLFDLLPCKPETREHFELGNRHLFSCFGNSITAKKNIIVEGVLASFDKRMNDFQIEPMLMLAKRKKYRIIRVLLTSTPEVAQKRMKKRGTVVPVDIYQKLARAIRKTHHKEEFVIDTSALSQEELIQKVRALISN